MKKRYFIALGLTLWVLYITHHGWMGYKNAPAFDPMLLIIISVLSYLAGLKITSYLADFKNLQHKSRIEIIFLAIFFIFLFVPMSKISQNKYSENENRFLAEYKPLINNSGEINFNFGKDFESWFNDRFAMRKDLIYLNYMYRVPISKNKLETPKIIYDKKTNWVLHKVMFSAEKKLPEKEISTAAKVLSQFNEFCNKHGIKLYVLFVPENTIVYNQYTNGLVKTSELNIFKNKVQKLQKLTNAKVIYPYDELKKASRNDYVAFKVDHHWTEYGAFVGYQTIMKEIKKDFPDVKIVREKDYNIIKSKLIRSDYNRAFYDGHTIKFLAPFLIPYANKIHDTEYKYYEHKKQDKLVTKIIDISKHKGKKYYYPEGSNYRLLEIGTSMNENLLQFTPYSFKDTKYIRLNNVKNKPTIDEFKIMKYNKKEILEYKPDIIIFCITISNITSLKNIFKEDN